jgi:hypothetical protein
LFHWCSITEVFSGETVELATVSLRKAGGNVRQFLRVGQFRARIARASDNRADKPSNLGRDRAALGAAIHTRAAFRRFFSS